MVEAPRTSSPARLHRLDKGRHDAAHVIAVVGVEILVLGADEGLLHQIGNVFGRRRTGGVPGRIRR